MTNARNRGPRALGDILGELYALRGYGRLRASLELEEAWSQVAGDIVHQHTRVGQVRRGVLSITVAHPALLEELVAFRKAEILVGLQRLLPDMSIQDIRFRVGPIDRGESQPDAAKSSQNVADSARGRAESKPDPAVQKKHQRRRHGEP
jgi:hypothetical protein